MKILFLHQRTFTYITHALALLLQKKYGVDSFCAYVFTRPAYDFLRSQKDIAYSEILFDEDLHESYKTEKLDREFLEKLERDYGIPNLWPYINIDRIVRFNQLVREYPFHTPTYTHEEMLRILQVKAKAILSLLEREKPDAVFIRFMGAMGAMLLYHIARKKGIQVLTLMPFGIQNWHILSEGHKRFPELEKVFAENRKNKERNPAAREKAATFLREFRDNPRVYYEPALPKNQPIERTKQLKFLLPNNLIKTFAFLLESGKRHYFGVESHDYSTTKPHEWLIDRVKRKARGLIGADDLYDVPTGEPFALFPLHSEPDISILLQGPFVDNQLYLAEKMARSLPVGMKLYVKEHPIMANFRPRSFYKELKKIPNVKVISPRVTALALSRQARIIFTISGAPGFEGLLLKKPVITFGDVYYNALSFVKNCRTLEELPSLVKHQIEQFAFDEEELLSFIAAAFEEGAEADLYRYWGRHTSFEDKLEGLAPIADAFAHKLSLPKRV